ncbi:hypothetical protein PGUG_04726 [Meyerozyma guilliermondii ATCC 6260]|uniref:Inner centromere protein ARK-binding domain-containing protein n=1 Tax=Meyerozyma guilliermondii (strain ATCC 6260 / CBS 566 / DSM 6381 / JCM 1539 / NBRC 10279 / NRRL Y-324) TaxID=294746 RepID=A5DN75_PICGU|nr:uncharacterized protein PGUG_04726 [Meyerozyma guilliermondii ATCC 6260]EDK40628.2 hypothetical protein PGUG_04726 [Meyerozyma guilliermondii ATCC 6260]
MSESFWSLTAAKRSGRELVPGTSRWVANELNVIDSTIVNETGHFVSEFKSGIDHVNDFMARVGEIYDKKYAHTSQKKQDFLRDIEEEAVSNSPTRFVNHVTPRRKTDATSRSTTAPESLHSSPMLKNWFKGSITHTPSPLKPKINESRQPLKVAPEPKPPSKSDLSFIPASEAIASQNHNRSSGAEDSFQAISTAIRKSIAGKLASNSDDDRAETKRHATENTKPKSVYSAHQSPVRPFSAASNGAEPRIPPLSRANLSYKTPKRSSVFVSLPSKEPFTISSNSAGDASNRARSPRKLERLDLEAKKGSITPAAGQPTALKISPNTDSIPRLSTHSIRKSLQRRTSIRPLPLDNVSTNGTTETKKASPIQGDGALSGAENSPVVRDVRNVAKTDNGSSAPLFPEASKTADQHNSVSANGLKTYDRISAIAKDQEQPLTLNPVAKEPRRNRSPIFSSIGDFVHRSRNVFMKGTTTPDLPPANSHSEHIRQSTTKPEAPILATSARASRSPRNTITRGRSPIRQLQIAKMRGANSALSDARIPLKRSREPSPERPKHIESKELPTTSGYIGKAISRSLSAAINTLGISPMKKRADLAPSKDESEAKPIVSPTKVAPSLPNENKNAEMKIKADVRADGREAFSFNSTKKKSIMAERSEAAALRPKQKIKIGMNHKVHKVPAIPPPLQLQKTPGDRLVKEETRHTSEAVTSESEHRKIRRSTETKPIDRTNIANGRDTFGKVASVKRETLRRQTTERKERESTFPKGTGNAVPLPDAARGRFHRNENTVKRRKTVKESKTPSRVRPPADFDSVQTHSEVSVDPYRTPAKRQYSPGSLPAINTDDEDNGKHPVLSPWAESPQLLKLVQQSVDIDPVTIFGEIPKLRIEEVFDSQASRHRARPSPNG